MSETEKKAIDAAYDWHLAQLFDDFLDNCRVYGALEADQRFREGIGRLRGAYDACRAILDDPDVRRTVRDKAEAMRAKLGDGK